MANPERGEVEITIRPKEGPEKSYTLKLSTNAAVVLQKKTGKKIGQLLKEVEILDFVVIRQLVWLLLQKYHAEEFKSEESAGDFVDDAGGIVMFVETLQELASVNQPDKSPGGGPGGNPQDAQSGTGESSSSSVAGSV